MEHLFVNCTHSKVILDYIRNKVMANTLLTFDIKEETILLGGNIESVALNYILIYRCKSQNLVPKTEMFKQFFKEKLI
jgi:hypothetical protein